MTTRVAHRVWAFAAALLLAGCVASVGRRGGLDEGEQAKLPAEVRESYDLFAQKCSRCHTLSRPLGAFISDVSHWRQYVTRMRRQPGSGISEDDAERILVFLEYYTREKNKEGATGGE